MHLIEFTDGSDTTEFVGKKSAFKDASDFLQQCKGEFDWKFDDLDFEVKTEHVVDGLYCRYYPKMPGEMSYLGLEGGGYTYCDNGRGAFEVYVIPLRELRSQMSFANAIGDGERE